MFNVALTPELPPPRERARRADPSKPYVMMAGYLGTMVAGGLYPGPLFLIDALFSDDLDPNFDVAFLIPAFPIGAIFAGLVGLPVFLFLALAHYSSALGSPVLVASIAGGWTGAFAASGPAASTSSEQGFALQFVAMTMGMIGGGLTARWIESVLERDVLVRPSPRIQMTLRQLFAITTWAAAFAATLAALPLPPRTKERVLICLGIQATLIAAYWILRSVRDAAKRPRDTPALETVAADVPRETTAAVDAT